MTTDEPTLEIGYSARLFAVLAGAAGLAALLLWVRVLAHGWAFDIVLALLLTVLAAGAAVLVVAARSPLLVVDRRGVRAKIAGEWCGVPWVSISETAIEPRRMPWSDGHLLIAVHHPSHLTESLSPRSQRQVAVTQRRYHAELEVPLGAITGVSRSAERDLDRRLARMIGRASEPQQ